MNADLGAVSNRVLEALLNGVYQGLLVAGLVWLGLRLLPRSNAATRYAAGFAGMVIIAALPLLHLGESFRGVIVEEGRKYWKAFGRLGSTPHPGALPSGRLEKSPRIIPIPGWDEAQLSFQSEGVTTSLSPSRAREESQSEERVPAEKERFSSEGPELDSASAGVIPAPFAKKTMPEWKLGMRSEIAAAVLGAWLLASAWRLLDLARQCLLLRSMKRRAHAASDELRTRFEILRGEMRVNRKVGLALCRAVQTPIAAGFRKPLVLLPAKLSECEKPARLDGILRHELAHVHRRDDWTNLIQQVVHAVFFFHPGVIWLSRRLSVEREIACDDHAIAAIASRREYALLLAEFASGMHCRQWAAAPGAWSKKGQLKERINMILNAKRNASTRLAGASAGMLTVGAALIALLIMQAGPRVALADEPVEVAVSAAATAPAAVPAPPDAPEISVTAVVKTDAIVSADGKALAVISGPRTKPGKAILAAPAALPHPAPAPVVVAVADVPDVAQPPQPRQPRPVVNPRNRNLEERLERLEKLVESLAANKNENRKHDMHFDFKLKGDDWEPKFHEKMAKLETDFKTKFNKEEIERIHEHAKKAAEHGAKEAERVAKDVERAMKDMERNIRVEKHARVEIHADGKPVEMRKKALESQRKALEKQLEAIERQIDQIEDEHDRAEEERERAREQAEEDRERAREQAEEARERAREQAEQARERAQEDRERAQGERERAQKERDQARQEQGKSENNSQNPENPKRRKQGSEQ